MNEQPNQADERRRYYRIDDKVALSYRVISVEDMDAAINRQQIGYPDTLSLASSFATTSTQMKHSMDRIKQDTPEVAAYLQGLNEKLDLLVQLLAASENELADHPTHEVNLSASGVSFRSPAALPKGDVLEMKLLLFPTYVCVHCFGNVARCNDKTGADSPARYDIGVDFTHIRENERDLIIRHITKRQATLLREARHAFDSAE